MTLADLSAIVLPLWQGRGSLGYVLRQYLDVVMRSAVLNKHRLDNPAAQIKELAPKGKAIVHHQPSLSHRKVREAMRAVEASSHDIAVKLAVLFTVLCAARVGEVLGARWSEFDLDDRVWTRPGERMKSGSPHRVPLSEQALAIIHRIRALDRDRFGVFVMRAGRSGFREMDPHDLSKVLRPLGYVDEESRSIVARISNDVPYVGDGGGPSDIRGVRSGVGAWAR